MGIRKAKIEDWSGIKELLDQLDYPDTDSFIIDKIKVLLAHPDAELLVYEYNGGIIGFISIHFIPQIALEGDFARISYFAVDEKYRGKGIGREIEEYCTCLARMRRCDRIELHCHSRRVDAHRFYLRQGYVESPKYFIKKLV